MEAFRSGINLGDTNQVLQALSKFNWPDKLPPWKEKTQVEQEWLASRITSLYERGRSVAHGSPPGWLYNFEGDFSKQTNRSVMKYLKPVFESLNWCIGHEWDRAYNRLNGHFIWSTQDPHIKPRPPLPKYVLQPAHDRDLAWSYAEKGIQTNHSFIIKSNNAEVKFPVHPIILMTRSKYFTTFFSGAMFDPNKNESSFEYTTNAELFKDLLYFIYKGKPSANTVSMLDDLEYCLSLYDLAYYTRTKSLIAFCRQHLDKSLNTSNLIQIASAAKVYADESMLNACRWYVDAYPNYIQECEVDDGMSIEQLIELIQVTEDIRAVSTPELAEKRHVADSLQELLCQQLDSINTAEDFLTLCKYPADIKNKKEDAPLFRRLKLVCDERMDNLEINALIKANDEASAAYNKLISLPM